jgi:hypothetical protein
VAFIFLVLLSIVIFLVGRSSLQSLSENWTSPTPVTLPTVDVEPATLDELVARVDTFAANVDAGTPTAPIALTQDEINALIQHHPDWQDLRDKVYVSIEDDLVKGEVNFPLPALPFLSGRYLHGTATFDILLEDGRLEIYVQSATVNDQPFPDEFMTTFRNQNLAQDFMRDNREARELVDKLESIRIEDGTLIVVPKQTTGADASPATPGADESMPPAEAPLPEQGVDEQAPIVEQPEEPAAI